MAYDEELADWVRTALKGERALDEKRMFGGIGMLLNGNMAVAVRGKGGLLVRIDPDDADEVLLEPGAKLMKMRGKQEFAEQASRVLAPPGVNRLRSPPWGLGRAINPSKAYASGKRTLYPSPLSCH